MTKKELIKLIEVLLKCTPEEQKLFLEYLKNNGDLDENI